MNDRKRASLWSSVLTLAAMAAPGAARADETLRSIGDVLQIALPGGAMASTFFADPEPGRMWDRQGTRQFLWTYGTAWGSTYLIKGVASKMRPNGEDKTSFPSGHTMSAFTGAAFFDARYGWKLGAPAYALALLTGYSRVRSSWHYADDVVAGASIGLISNWFFVSPQPGKVAILPTMRGGELGVRIDVSGGDRRAAMSDLRHRRRGGYHFAFGPAKVARNRVRSKADEGDTFDLDDLEKRNDPVTTASANVHVALGDRSVLWISYSPFEAKDFGSFPADTRFGGAVFPAGRGIESGWRLHDLHATYRYDLVKGSRAVLGVGVGAGAYDSFVRLVETETGTAATVEDYGFYPFGRLAAAWDFAPWLTLAGAAEGMAMDKEHFLTATAGITWQVGPAWDAGLSYMYLSRRIDTDEIYNDTIYNVGQLSVTRWW